MDLFKGFKVEILKLKHSSFWIFQFGFVVLGLFFLGTYFKTYVAQSEVGRLKLVFEMLAAVFPLVCSVSVAYLIRQEEQISAFYGMLAAPRRKKVICQKIAFIWLLESAGIAMITLAIGLLSSGQREVILKLIGMYSGMVILSLFFYLFHFFLNLKFGMGISLFLGIFESMQGIIYSNIELYGKFRYIPFAWLMEWNRDVMEHMWVAHRAFWCSCILLLIVFLILFIKWFECWEGRKNYGV